MNELLRFIVTIFGIVVITTIAKIVLLRACCHHQNPTKYDKLNL